MYFHKNYNENITRITCFQITHVMWQKLWQKLI